MAKKVTKKKIAKPGSKKKAPSAKAKKTAKKTVKKKSTSKTAAKKTAKKTVKKKPTTKKTAPKPAAKKTTKKTAAAKSKTPAKKTTKKATTKTKSASGHAKAANNGKSAAAQAKTAPTPIRRVVRPAPLAPDEPDIDDWTPLSDAKLRKAKSDLSRKELNNLKQLLMEKRAEIVGDVMNMEESRTSGNGGDLSNMPLHMADVGSDNYEQEFTLGLVESERKLLIEIDAALMRIKNRTYGICIITGDPIPPARLEIKPWAKFGIEIVRKREKLGLHSF